MVASESGVLAGWQQNSIGEESTSVNFAGSQDGSPAGLWELNFPGSIRGAFQINGSAPTLQAAGEELMSDVTALVQTSALTQAQADALTRKLKAFIDSLDRSNVGAACGRLGAFINQVRGLVRAGKLSLKAGQSLIDSAESIQG